MDRFAARLDEYLTREQPEPTACECGNGLHYEIDRELGACEDCRAEADATARARRAIDRTILDVTARIAAAARRSAKHVDVALDYDAMLGIGAATEAPQVAL